MKIVTLFAIFVIAILAANPVRPGEFTTIRCGTYELHLGDLEEDVLRKCGSPTYTEVERWIYDKGGETRLVITFNGAAKYRRRVM